MGWPADHPSRISNPANTRKIAIDRLRAWRESPLLFVRDCFGVEPDAWQAEVLSAFPAHQRLALKSCKGPGKSCVLAWLIWNFLATRPNPKIACTSISAANLRDGLWTELAKWHGKSPVLQKAFTWNKERITAKHAPETHWASARAWSQSADQQQQADTLAGLHADYLLFVLDEAGGIPDGVLAAAEAGLATGIETKLLIAGNPTAVSGPLYRACTSERKLWHLTEITSDPDDPKRTPRVSSDWARQQIEKYGRDNPWVLVNVFGKFPPASLNSLLGPDDVSAAMNRKYMPDSVGSSPKVLGVDVARFGDDRTVIMPRQGLICGEPLIMRGARTEEIAAQVVHYAMRWEAEAIFVDGTGGYGAGVIDAIRLARLNVSEISASGKADDPRYFNKRAECWFLMAKWIKEGGSLPNIPEFAQELTAPTYLFHNGKMQLEAKDHIKQRIGVSPDISDATALTFARPLAPRQDSMLGFLAGMHGGVKSEYDPLERMRDEARR